MKSKLISLIGNIGVGKTTAAKAICDAFGFNYFGESHDDRPFQHLAKQNPHFTFHNQINFMMERALQEEKARMANNSSVFDGGLDMDYYVFTKLFLNKGSITLDEFNQLTIVYDFLRRYLPPPDLVVYLYANEKVVTNRYQARKRINLAVENDIPTIKIFLEEYINIIPIYNILYYDTNGEEQSYRNFISTLGRAL